MKKFIELAALLFELEIERIGNDSQIHFGDLGNNWTEKFGEKSIEFADKFVSKKEDINELAKMLKEDFAKGEWEADEDGLYNYMMPTEYGGFICGCLEKQLADFTGVGTQMEIFA